MKFFQNILFLGFVLSCFYIYGLIDHSRHAVTVSDDAIRPDLLLENTRLYTREHAKERSLKQLYKAIQAMRNIEDDVDDQGKEAIEVAINDLIGIYEEIQSGQVVEADLRSAFTKAFNALTYAELKVSEVLINTDMKSDAIIALGYGKVHIKNALKFADKEKFEDELRIYTELDSMISSPDMTKEETIRHLNKVLAELDQLQVQ